MDDSMIDLQEESVLSLIKMYCRESGVRNLQKHIEKVGLFLVMIRRLFYDFCHNRFVFFTSLHSDTMRIYLNKICIGFKS